MNVPLVVYGPHCGHDDCGWITCDATGLVEFSCSKPGCPWCGGPAQGTPEQWATMPAEAAKQPGYTPERLAAYYQKYPYVRRGPDDDYARLEGDHRL